MSTDRKAREERERIRLLERRAKEYNARNVPDHPGHVRTTGARRQFHAEVRGGRLHYTEI